MICVGVDVGGRRKGFHVAAVRGRAVTAGPQRLADVDVALRWIREIKPRVVALDSPMTCAAPGERSRAGERELMRKVCGIRWTPEEAKLADNPYYEWIVCGRELYEALGQDGRGSDIIEVFPTASWTVWAGKRGSKRRSRWTQTALEHMNLEGLPPRRLNQDDRDAIAAALTARLHARGQTRAFGDIVVPTEAPT